MATDTYWEEARRRLLAPDTGALAFVPMTEGALVQNGPTLAVTDALRLRILSLNETATQVLEFVPRLEAALQDVTRFTSMPEYRQRETAAYLRQALHIGRWLRNDVVEPSLAQDAYDYLFALNRWWGKQITEPNLHDLMLLSCEAGRDDNASRLYQAHERRPISFPLRDLRFTGNPRAVLFACLNRSNSEDRPRLIKALGLFLQRATRWESHLQPIPYVGEVTLARTLRICRLVLGLDSSLPAILPLLR